MRLKSRFDVERVTDDTVWIIDCDDGGMSVTNDAEAVVENLLARYGNRRIVYRDSMGRWDILMHDGVRFTGFAPNGGPPPSTSFLPSLTCRKDTTK